MLDEGLAQLIASSSPITAIVGTPATRSDKTNGVFGGQLPEATPFPAMVIEQIAGDPVMTMDGPDLARKARFQFSSHGKTRLSAKQLQRALRRVLENFTGSLPDGTVIQNMQTVLESDAFEYAPFDFNAPLDVEIFYVDSGD